MGLVLQFPEVFREVPKWQRNYSGPYLVVRILSPVTAAIQKSRRADRLVVHIDKLKLYVRDAPASWVDNVE